MPVGEVWRMLTKRFLIVVDMQNDFIDGSLGTNEAQAIVPAVAERLRAARQAGEIVIATMDTHGADYLDTREGRLLPVPHCVRGTDGWRICPQLRDLLKGCKRVEKPTFGSARLPGMVRRMAGEAQPAIELVGLCTDICVVSNALLLKAAFPEAEITVRRDCCAGVTPQRHEAALATMASCQIGIV